MNTFISKYQYLLVWAGLLVVYTIGLFTDVMDVDAAQYASISREMANSGSWLEVLHRGEAYLDKPPLLFWLSALSFKIFGVATWSYKLPSVLVLLLGFYATYRLAKVYYEEWIARTSALMLGSCVAMFLIANDVRTDTLLMSFMVIGCWQVAEFLEHRKWRGLFFGSIAFGLAMLAKGPIGLMVPALAFGTHWLLKKQWRNLFRWEWLVAMSIILLVLSPMLVGLYQQWGPEGLNFFFWNQSFGRLTGDNDFINTMPQKQPFSPFYFVHTTLWSFLPWTFFFIGGLIVSVQSLFTKVKIPEYLTLGGFVLPLIALTFSDYKLPNYIYITFPFVAILAGHYLHRLLNYPPEFPIRRMFLLLQAFLLEAIVLLVAYLSVDFFGAHLLWVGFAFVLGSALNVFFIMKPKSFAVFSIGGIAVIIGLFLNTQFNRVVMPYQAYPEIGRYLHEQELADKTIALLAHTHSLEFYAQTLIPYAYDSVSLEQQLKDKEYIVTNDVGLEMLKGMNLQLTQVKSYPYYPVQKLSFKFLNPETRSMVMKELFLIKIQ